MRVRIQLLAPFEQSKVLLPLPPSVRTISDLKKHVRTSLSSVLSLSTSAKDILLEVDGFELLAGSSVDVIEGSDVVTVRLRASSSKPESGVRKRSTSGSRDGGGDGKRRRIIDSTAQGPSRQSIAIVSKGQSTTPSSSSADVSSSSGSASSSSSAESSSSASSSSLSSSSVVSSDSSIADPPSVQDNRPFPVPPIGLRLSSSINNVKQTPPGQGKPSTQERNQRRKLARQLTKQAELNVHHPIGSEPSPQPVVAATNFDIVTRTQSSLPVPKTMANRNKKKGFLQEMASLHGTKTVFGDDAQGSSTPFDEQSQISVIEPSIQVPSAEATSQRRNQRERLVPPSEQDLPSNVFVTHVVYQRNGWTPRGGKKNKSHGGEGGPNGVDGQTAEEEEMQGDESILEGGKDTQGIGATDATINGDHDTGDIWIEVETGFEALTPVSRAKLPTVRSKIAWKELQLDPYTFSPQVAVQIAEVKTVSETDISVHRMDRYAAEDVNGFDPGLGDTESSKIIALAEVDAEPKKYRLIQ